MVNFDNNIDQPRIANNYSFRNRAYVGSEVKENGKNEEKAAFLPMINPFGISVAYAKSDNDDHSDKKVQPPKDGKTYVGAWFGVAPQEGEKKTMNLLKSEMDRFGKVTGVSPKIVHTFENWNDTWKYKSFPEDFCKEVDKMGKIPMITWEPSGLPFDVSGKETYLDEFIHQFVEEEGEIYEYAKKWAEQAKAYGKPFLLRPFHEMNLSFAYPWTGWMNGGKKGIVKFKLAWRKLYQLFKDEGAHNATFIWCPEAKSQPVRVAWNTISKYYPGDKYVDWVGVDGYRDDTSDNFNSVFASSLRYLESLGKPVIICETSSISDERKDDYIKQLFNTKGLAGIVWFNEDKEEPWNIDAPMKTTQQKEDDVFDFLFDEPEEKEEEKGPVKNEGLLAFRNIVGNTNKFIFTDTKISINTKGINREVKKVELVPEEEIELKTDIMKLKDYESHWKYFFPLPSVKADIKVALAEKEEQLSGYKGRVDGMDGIRGQYKLSLAKLDEIETGNRNYLKALAKRKDIYYQWANSEGELKDMKKLRVKSEELCNTLLNYTTNLNYIDSFNNKFIPDYIGVLTWLDTTMYKDKEIFGYKASTYATLGDIEVSKGNYDKGMKYYKEAKTILDREEFDRAFYHRQYAIKKGFLKPVDPNKDLKTLVKLGIAMIKTVNFKNDYNILNEGIKDLEEIAYMDEDVAPRIKLRAKLYLAKALLKYYKKDNIKARKAYIILRELLSTELGGEAQDIWDKLTG